MNGAEKSIKNEDGKLPIDLAKDTETMSKKLSRELVSNLS
jgi:hypothetical protein